MKILTIVGARPQFVKAAVVSRAIAEHNKKARPSRLINEVIVHTGQHYDHNMSAVFFEEMQIPAPNYFLDIHGLSHGAMTGQMLEKIEKTLQHEKPDMVLVYGDTNTTLAGALAAGKLHIPVAHVEAGLRSFNQNMPEEINRVLADHLSTWLFYPTQKAGENLRAEGICHKTDTPGFGQTGVFHVGDVMLDAAMYYARTSQNKSLVLKNLEKEHGIIGPYVLCTVHRAENTDDPKRLSLIFSALCKIAKETPIVFPLHPRTKKQLANANPARDCPGLVFIDPVGYLEMLELIKHCSLVMTDSGGLQKEACFFRQPCVTLRDETEWVELVSGGCNMLAGADEEKIFSAYQAMIKRNVELDLAVYGNGRAGKKVVEILSRA